MTMKIFQLNDCDWFADETLESAIEEYCAITGVDRAEAIDDPHELSDKELDRLQFHFTDDNEQITVVMSFRDALAKRIADGEHFPYIFASTEQ